ncbi:MAG: hypothetical protein HY775_08515 [Acidobacteria bacterium]|nr:hypothetical protein [Acidobacteriota bacterium]
MKKLALLVVLLWLVPATALASPTPVLGTGGEAVGSRGSEVTTCNARVEMILDELTEDLSPPQVRGKVSAFATGTCIGTARVTPYATDVHIYVAGVEIDKYTCLASFKCGAEPVSFTVPAGSLVTATSDQYWDVTAGGAWNAATPRYCSIKNPRVWCGAYAAATP